MENNSESNPLLKATHGSKDRPLRLGQMEIACAVLENGMRVLTRRSVQGALEMGQDRGDMLVRVLGRTNIKPFITPELATKIAEPVFFVGYGGKSFGYEATVLVDVCEALLAARQAGALAEKEMPYAQAAEALTRAFAKVGIIALVDEATGYQQERERDALHQLLAVYLSEERLRWAKMFPDEFYKQIYRLKGWTYTPHTQNRTPYIGKITNKLVYEKMPPGILDELKARNPVIPESRRRGAKHHQFLSDALGRPDLSNHLLQLIALMKGSDTWEDFEKLVEKVFPSPMPLFDHLKDDEAS